MKLKQLETLNLGGDEMKKKESIQVKRTRKVLLFQKGSSGGALEYLSSSIES